MRAEVTQNGICEQNNITQWKLKIKQNMTCHFEMTLIEFIVFFICYSVVSNRCGVTASNFTLLEKSKNVSNKCFEFIFVLCYFTGFVYNAEFVRSRRSADKFDLMLDGYLFSKVCQTDRSTFWRCRQARSVVKCKARCVTREVDGVVKVKLSQSQGVHNHLGVDPIANDGRSSHSITHIKYKK